MGVSLQEKAMLANLQIRAWTARKCDKEVSRDVAQRHARAADFRQVGRYNKVLVAREAINKIERIEKRARDFHYKNTLPWLDTGGRILPAGNFTEYSEGMRRLKAEFQEAVRDFLDAYPQLQEEARNRLGDLFREEDYPSPTEVEAKFDFNVSISPVPAADDFRVALAEDEISRIRAKIEERNRKALKEATRELRKRLLAVVEHMAKKLEKDRENGKSPIFRDSLISNIMEMAEAVSRMNIAEDHTLENLTRRVKKMLQYDPEDLRKSPLLRRQAAIRARNLADEISRANSDQPDPQREVEAIVDKMNPFYFQSAAG